VNQMYEDYWSITLEYSDIFGNPFNMTLKMIVDFIDEMNSKKIVFSSEQYELLQTRINDIFPKNDMASTRKSINQFVKLGFISTYLSGYHKLTKQFLISKGYEKQALFSKIVYESSSFSRSITNHSFKNEINFLIKTLYEVGKLTSQEIAALMLVNISEFGNGYLKPFELRKFVGISSTIHFEERKYNQIRYFIGILKKLSGVIFKNDILYPNNQEIIEKIRNDDKISYTNRDPYLQQLYKQGLVKESQEHYEKTCCFVEKIAYPSLIASHIKPFSVCDSSEAYDVDNGLLLSRDIDFLFDKGYISFLSDGNLVISKQLPNDVAEKIKELKLDKSLLSNRRQIFLDYHRKHIFRN
jgi:putative restriction endonuclease